MNTQPCVSDIWQAMGLQAGRFALSRIDGACLPHTDRTGCGEFAPPIGVASPLAER